jgi:alkanesulfonate monooxygenase
VGPDVTTADSRLRLIGSCPAIGRGTSGADYLRAVERASSRAELHGWDAVLIYADHRQVDPWLVAQVVVRVTSRLVPLVAVQPIYAHPYTIAKSIATIGHLYDRPIWLNMIAGGAPLDLESLCDSSPHDRRYDRIVEYATIIRELFSGQGVVTRSGEFYQVKHLQLLPKLRADLFPRFTISGSSAAGLEAARRLGAIAVQYLRPTCELAPTAFDGGIPHGTRLGIIARETTEAAWRTARQRYPESEDRVKLRQMTSSLSDSVWVKDLSREISLPTGSPYWLGPFKNLHAPCPFLVGSCREIVTELVEYVRLGIRTFLLVEPEDEEDYARISAIFSAAHKQAEAFMSCHLQDNGSKIAL